MPLKEEDFCFYSLLFHIVSIELTFNDQGKKGFCKADSGLTNGRNRWYILKKQIDQRTYVGPDGLKAWRTLDWNKPSSPVLVICFPSTPISNDLVSFLSSTDVPQG